MPYELMTVKEVADYLRVTEGTLYKWTRKGKGPPRTRVGGAIRYRRSDVERWLDSSCARPESSSV